MRVIYLTKKSGKMRRIYVPDQEEKARLRALVPSLTEKCAKLATYAHAFIPGRSPVTNALEHKGFAYTYCFDLTEFFDSVKPDQVKQYLNAEEMKACFVEGAPRQGLPTSPCVANLAGIAIDQAIVKALKKKGVDRFSYTRYADDIALSFDAPELIPTMKQVVVEVVRRNGFTLNVAKTRLQWAGAGRRVICGVAIDQNGELYPLRKFRRRLRAAEDQDPKSDKCHGMREWAKLKRPRTPEEKSAGGKVLETAQELITLWKLVKLEKTFHPYAPPDVVLASRAGVPKAFRDPGDVPPPGVPRAILTRDPAYVLGLSNFTEGGWGSCMAHPPTCSLKCHYGSTKWYELEGAYIAALLGEEYKTYGRVSRRVMRSRSLVFKLRDGAGTMVWTKVYPKDDRYGTNNELVRIMEAHGILSIPAAVAAGLRGTKAVGSTRKKGHTPYVDPPLVAWATKTRWGVKI